MKKSAFLLALGLFLSCISFAQESPSAPSVISSYQGNIGISLLHVRPLDALADNGYQNGWGLSLEYLSPELGKKLPINLQAGIRLDGSNHGRYRTNLDLTEPIEAPVRYRLSNSQTNFATVVRLISRDAPIRLYADAMAGIQTFTTAEVIDMRNPFASNEGFSSEKNFSRLDFALGVGAGVEIRINELMSVDARAIYRQGDEMRFAKLDEVSFLENEASYPTVLAPSTAWGLQLGIRIKMID